MASRASDVLAVEYLQRAARAPAPLRVVPLFETSRDLQNAAGVMESLLAWSTEASPGICASAMPA